MRLNQFRFLAALKEYGTISEAAQQLYVSQPSLSAAIKELETELGFPVVKRTRKGVIFTARGEEVLRHSRNILQELEAILALRDDSAETLRGALAVGCVPYIYHGILLDTLMELKSRYPATATRLTERSSPALVEAVHRRELDLGVIMIYNIEQTDFETLFQKYRLIWQKLFDDEMHFWVGPSHPLYGRGQVTMAEALQYPFITYRDILDNFNRDMLLAYNRRLDIIQIDDRASLYKYLRKSQAITVMPLCVQEQEDAAAEEVKPLRIADFAWTAQIGLVYAGGERLSLEQRTFMEMLVARVGRRGL